MGFFTDVGAHTARTLMFKDIFALLEVTNAETSFNEFRAIVVDDNRLHKASVSGRRKSFAHLKKMYGLDPTIPLFRAFRWAWSRCEENERPILALLYALCRDDSIRTSASYILPLSPGSTAEIPPLSAILERAYPNRYSPAMIKSMTQNLLSSWTQSGHLSGRRDKQRIKASSHTSSAVFALFVGSLMGFQGRTLFDTLWVRALDVTDHELQESVRLATRKGWMKYHESGGMMEITFSPEIVAGGRPHD
ncbi:hypothetical protein DSECCO2_656630 [anaerobic digester metagenome]